MHDASVPAPLTVEIEINGCVGIGRIDFKPAKRQGYDHQITISSPISLEEKVYTKLTAAWIAWQTDMKAAGWTCIQSIWIPPRGTHNQ